MNDGEDAVVAALAPFGWTCGLDFWKRYYTDPWVFNLVNAAVALSIANDVLLARCGEQER